MATKPATPAKRAQRDVLVRVRPGSIVDNVFVTTSRGEMCITHSGVRVPNSVAAELLTASNHLATE
jgi:hypothetical protein